MSQTKTGTVQLLILKLQKKTKHVTWDESVIDNEHMNKRKSNKCCIFHKKREFNESSSEDDDSSDCQT